MKILLIIIFQFAIFYVNAQKSIQNEKAIVKNKFGNVYQLINDFEINKVDKAIFIEQLFILLADTTKNITSQVIKKLLDSNFTKMNNYIHSNDVKIFKSLAPIYKGRFPSISDSLRYRIYSGISFLYSMNWADGFTKFSNIDTIIAVTEYVNSDTVVKFNSFKELDKNKVINKTISDCLNLRDDYYNAEKLRYNEMSQEAQLIIRKDKKNNRNYIQYFDYLDKLKK